MALWVENETRRANRNLLLVNGLIVAALIVTAAANYRYGVNFLLGCRSVSNTELAGIASPDQPWRNFVTVKGTKSIDTEYRDIVNHTQNGTVVSTEVKDQYILLRVGNYILLVKASPGPAKLEYSGELVTTAERVQDDLLRPLAAEDAELAKTVLPFTLNAADYRENGFIMLAIGIPFFALAGWNLWKAMRRSAEIETAPVWKHLAVYGNAEQLSSQIEGELQPAMTKRYGKLHVTPQWMVQRKLFSTWVSPIADMTWIYKKVTKHSVNFIPTGKTYSVVLVGRHRQRTEVQMKEKAVNELLADMATRVPWAIFGFTQEMEKAWQKDPAGVIAAVDTRYQKSLNKSAAAATPGS